MSFSFKILVHDIQIQSKELLIIQKPIVSINLALFPRLAIEGKGSLSKDKKVFGHGKSLVMQINIVTLKEILQNNPLEVLLLNDTTILGGARVNMLSFIQDLENMSIDKTDFKFRRGTFHLMDPIGTSFALADISICFHPMKVEQKQEEEDKYEPAPDQISLKKQKSSLSKQKSVNAGSPLQSPFGEPYQMKPKQAQQQIQIPQRSEQISKQQSPIKPQKIPIKLQEIPKFQASKKSGKKENVNFQPQNVEKSISLMDWVTGYHCPPPMILDKKIYYQQPAIQKEVRFQGQKRVDIGVQTEGIFLYEPPQDRRDNAQIMENDNQQRASLNRVNTEGSEYTEDFESMGQSQQILSSQLIKKSVVGQQQQQQSNPVRRTKSAIIHEQQDDAISEIYSEDFEQLSQSQSMRRSQLQSQTSAKYIKQRPEEVSESYINDFESVSQSYSRSKGY